MIQQLPNMPKPTEGSGPGQSKIAQKMAGREGKGRHAAVGGEVAASNGHFYKGGQFLPSTDAPPGTFKYGGKVLKTGREQIGPNEWSIQPTPFSRSIYGLIGTYAQRSADGTVEFRPGIKDATGAPVTPDSDVRPGVKGILSSESFKMKELIDFYNKGMRWVDVKPAASEK